MFECAEDDPRFLEFLELEKECYELLQEDVQIKKIPKVDLEDEVVRRLCQEKDYSLNNLVMFSPDYRMKKKNKDFIVLEEKGINTQIGEDEDVTKLVYVNIREFTQLIGLGILEGAPSETIISRRFIEFLEDNKYNMVKCELHGELTVRCVKLNMYRCYCGLSRDEMWRRVSEIVESEIEMKNIVNKTDEFVGLRRFDVTLPHLPDSGNDGQLKIATDVLLSVSDMCNKFIEREGIESFKVKIDWEILVIGSASPDGVESGCSYELISELIVGGSIYLVDPYETSSNYKIKGCVYYGEKRMYNYEDLAEDVKRFDLILNDAWVSNQYYSKDFDPGGLIRECENFSIKNFVFESEVFGNVYTQRFKTKGERRVVSRDPKKMRYLNNNFLGDCAGCSELKYRCALELSKKVCMIYMKCHKRPCIEMEERPRVDLSSINWIEVENIFPNERTKYYCLEGDKIDRCQLLPKNFRMLSECRVMFTRKVIDQTVLDNAMQVVIAYPGNKTFVSVVIDERRKNKMEFIEAKKPLNSSHDADFKNRKGKRFVKPVREVNNISLAERSKNEGKVNEIKKESNESVYSENRKKKKFQSKAQYKKKKK